MVDPLVITQVIASITILTALDRWNRSKAKKAKQAKENQKIEDNSSSPTKEGAESQVSASVDRIFRSPLLQTPSVPSTLIDLDKKEKESREHIENHLSFALGSLETFANGWFDFVRISEDMYKVESDSAEFILQKKGEFFEFRIELNRFGLSPIFRYNYSFKHKRGRVWSDRLPTKFSRTDELLARVISEITRLESNEHTHRFDLATIFEESLLYGGHSKEALIETDYSMDKKDEPFVSAPLEALCRQIDTLALAIEVNDFFDSLPIDIRHRFEVLANDYDQLIQMFQRTSSSSLSQKEEAVSLGLTTILAKLQEIYVLIGEMEHNSFLRQVIMIEQR